MEVKSFLILMKIKQNKGRPPTLLKGRPVNLYLDNESIETAKKIGKGSISNGIRKSVKLIAVFIKEIE